MSVREPSK